MMTLEDIWFGTRPLLQDCLYYLDRILTVVFFLETSLKLFAMGTVMYFGNAWCWLDFVIVAVSLINFGASLLGAGNIPIFKTMRTLRALRPLRAMAKMEGMKVVVNALVGALPVGPAVHARRHGAELVIPVGPDGFAKREPGLFVPVASS